jgi:hypothetical protein
MMQAEAARLANQTPAANGRTEAVPNLLQSQGVDPATGQQILPHIADMNREVRDIAPTPSGGDSNPFTGWGFSSTRRATDASGADLPVIPNQELKMGSRLPIPAGSEVAQVTPTGAVNPQATTNGPGASPTITTTDTLQLQRFWDHLNSLGLTPPFPRP